MILRSIFQSTRPVWGATAIDELAFQAQQFQSTRPVWGATIGFADGHLVRHNFNPRAPCGARPPRTVIVRVASNISIHAPRVGRDRFYSHGISCGWNFNPRAPCGARRSEICALDWAQLFQSTRPVWGATVNPKHTLQAIRDFNPRAPCGARPFPAQKKLGLDLFQSTRPVWGATGHPGSRWSPPSISIHAPRVGRDQKTLHVGSGQD